MALIFPTFEGVFRWRYKVDFDGDRIERVVVFSFNGRDDFAAGTDGAWYLDLYDAGNTPIVLGTRLSLGRDLWRKYRGRPGMPRGQLQVVSTTGAEPNSTNLGKDVLVQYERAT